MARFLTALSVTELGQDRWRLNSTLRYESDILNGILDILAGFLTDLESIPRWLPLLYAVLYGTAHAASVVHDFLYKGQTVSRKMADDVMYEAMRATGQPRWKAWTVWAGLRMGGWIRWQRHAAAFQERSNP